MGSVVAAAAPMTPARSVAASEGATSAAPYASAQAYRHLLRAELALVRADLATAHDELRLALVYDPTSLHLHERLVRLALSQGTLTKARRYAERARAQVGDRAPVLRLVAEVAKAEGRLGDAERVLRAPQARWRSDLETGLALAHVVAAQQRRPAALRILRRVARHHPRSPRPWIDIANHHRAAGRWAASTSALAAASSRAPLESSAARALADGYERTLRLADAQAAWVSIARRAPADAGAALQAGRLALARGHRKRAQRWVEEAVRRDPEAAVGLVFLAEGWDPPAVAALREAVRRRPSDPALRFGLGRALARSGRTWEALGHLGRVPAGAEDYVAARVLMSRALMRGGQHQRAELALEVALEARPSSAALVDRYAELLVRRGRREAALLATQRARSLAPLEVQLWSTELRLLDRLGRGGAARGLLKAAGHTLSAADCLRLITERHLRRGKRAAARVAAGRWVRAAPRAFEALLTASRVARSASSARRWARRAIGERPRDPEAIAALGIALRREGDHSAAVEHLRRAVRLNPWDARIAEAWGDAAAASGRRDEARRAYASARRALQGDRRALKADWRRDWRRLQRKRRRLRRPG